MTLQTQYKEYLKNNPDSKLTYEEWLDELSVSLAEAAKEEFNDWDVTLMDGLENEPPYISDDFQIGPDGAYEHSDRELDFQETLKSISQMLMIVKYNNGDISDIGNEIGIAIGKSIENIKDHEISEFIFGIKHGISLTNNTH